MELQDVDIMQQEDLENDLRAKLNKTIADAEDSKDQKLLEKEEARLEELTKRIELLKKRLKNPYTKISERQFLEKQINNLELKDLEAIKKEIGEIELRRATRKKQFETNENETSTGRLPNESEKDFLIRTGKITAFGTSNKFVLEETLETSEVDKRVSQAGEAQEESGEIEEVEEAEEHEDPQVSADDDEYIDEDNVEEVDEIEEIDENELQEIQEIEDEMSVEDQDAQDDGDEALYQKRLARWTQERSKNRKSAPENVEEWHLPHPDYKDAILDSQFKMPGEIFSNLFDYQKTCVQWQWELFHQRVGGIIGDEMGLGKTVQVIAFLASLQYSKKLDGPIMIVCPSTVMRQWVKECHKWWPYFRVVILHSIGNGMQKSAKSFNEDLYEDLVELEENDLNEKRVKKKLSGQKMQTQAQKLVQKVVSSGHILITTYSGLKIYSEVLLPQKWAYVVLDEGHKIRNPNAMISLVAKQIRSRHRIILSGTPIQNNLNELWSLFDFVYPGKLGTLPIFQREFVLPINMGGYANASNVQVQTSLKCAVALKNLITPYLLRRLKTDVAKDLPQKSEMVLFCKLTELQEKKYLDFLKSEDADSILSGRKNSLYGIDILKKICNHPDLLYVNSDKKQSMKNFGDPAHSGKMQVLKTLVQLWKSEGHKILLFTQTRQMLKILKQFMINLGSGDETINFLEMDGTTPIKNRQQLMDDFNNNPEIHLFLLTTRVGGLGVNLIGADRVIIFDPDWNPSTDLQARERAWRLGQKKDVTIYRLMTKGTIEEKIYQRQIFKQFLSNKVLKDPNQRRVFKMNEMNDLFTYGNDEDDENYYKNPRLFNKIVPGKKSKTNDDDFEEVAKITGVARLEEFGSTSNDKSKKSQKSQKEDRVLGDLLKSSGIRAEIGKDNLENGEYSNSVAAQEAEKIAKEAVESLKESKKLARKNRVGVPTWTGKFGSAGRIVKKGSTKNSKFSSSVVFDKVQKIEKQRKEMAIEEENEKIKQFSNDLLQNKEQVVAKVRDFLLTKQNYSAKSKNIISHLNIEMRTDSDIKLIRSILRIICCWDKENGSWVLMDEYRQM